MKRWLISFTGGMFIVAFLGILGYCYPQIEPWCLLPGIYLAALFPGVHSSDLKGAALFYNLFIYSITIYSVWRLISVEKPR